MLLTKLQAVNPLTTNDDYSRHRDSVACYQLVQFVLKIGSAVAERVGQGEVGGCTTLADSAWWLLQLVAVAAGYRKGLVCAVWPILLLSWANGRRNGPFTL